MSLLSPVLLPQTFVWICLSQIYSPAPWRTGKAFISWLDTKNHRGVSWVLDLGFWFTWALVPPLVSGSLWFFCFSHTLYRKNPSSPNHLLKKQERQMSPRHQEKYLWGLWNMVINNIDRVLSLFQDLFLLSILLVLCYLSLITTLGGYYYSWPLNNMWVSMADVPCSWKFAYNCWFPKNCPVAYC